MGRTLFIGDSHTMGYKSAASGVGLGSFTQWNDNNYAEIYSELTGRPVVVYALSGASNRLYTDWLRAMFDRYSDIDEVFICMASFNRFIIAADNISNETCIPSDYFTFRVDSTADNIHRYMDCIIKEDVMQLLNKPIYDDYDKFPGIEFSGEDGLISPDLRKHTYMQVKLFFELNTFVEKREFLNSVYTWDNICADNKANLHLFNFTNRLKFPNQFDYYGELKNTRVATKTVESFMKEKGFDHTKYLIEDKEHYNKDYHNLVAKHYIPWLQALRKF